MTPDERAALVAQMKSYVPGDVYYAMTLRANRRDQLGWSFLSHYVGMSPRGTHWELRQPSQVDPAKMTGLWEGVGQSWVSVHNDTHLALFLRLGGNGLVAEEVAQSRMPKLLEPSEYVHDADPSVNGYGFLATGHMDDVAAESGLAKGKLRMKVLARDDYRCVICGRRPRDYIDLQLDVHHLIPRRMGGPTAEENLVTLCSTCHKGLDPDYMPLLRELANLPGPADPLDSTGDEFKAEVARYRRLVAERLAKG